MSEFFEMSGYAAFVWPAYAIAVAGLLINAWLARRQLQQALEAARRKIATQESA